MKNSICKLYIGVVVIALCGQGAYADKRATADELLKASNGECVKPPAKEGVYSFVHCPVEGLSAVRTKDGKWGYVNKQGKIVIQPQYQMADWFVGGLARVRKDGQWGLIDKTGKVVIPIKYTQADNFLEGASAMAVQKGSKYGLVNRSGVEITKIEYEAYILFTHKDDLALVKKGGKYGFMNMAGKIVIPIKYDKSASFSFGDKDKVQVTLNGEKFYIDKKGNRVK